MDLGQLRRSATEIAKTVGALVEEKLGDRSQIEEQMRGIAKHVEKVVSDNLRGVRPEPSRLVLKVKRLENFKGELPGYATSGASGLDVRACLEGPIVLAPMQRALIPTGLSFEIPLGYEIQVRPRSGLAIKQGLSMVNTPGTIDADYRGEVKIIAINLGQEPITIQDQDRIAQLVMCPIVQPIIEDATELSSTERAHGGFGSTGV